jgi:hypothetical protein
VLLDMAHLQLYSVWLELILRCFSWCTPIGIVRGSVAAEGVLKLYRWYAGRRPSWVGLFHVWFASCYTAVNVWRPSVLCGDDCGRLCLAVENILYRVAAFYFVLWKYLRWECEYIW